MEPFIGQLMCVSFNFAPEGWMLCNGQVLNINANEALFALIGAQYGGDGRATFALPNLQGRVPMHFGQGQGLPTYKQGEAGGSPEVTLSASELPTHSHTMNAGGDSTSSSPSQNFPSSIVLQDGQPVIGYARTHDTTMAQGVISAAGGGRAHSNMQPYLVLNWIIAVTGIFPTKP